MYSYYIETCGWSGYTRGLQGGNSQGSRECLLGGSLNTQELSLWEGEFAKLVLKAAKTMKVAWLR